MSTQINDDRILDARDMAEEIELAKADTPRTFEDVMNQWTEACLEENRKADLLAIAPILRLGLLGHRLIQEANSIGMRDVMKQTREVLELK